MGKHPWCPGGALQFSWFAGSQRGLYHGAPLTARGDDLSSVERFELVLLLLTAVIALELLARRLRMPPAAAFILGGIVLALIPGTPDIELDPDLALVLFLPPMLLVGAYFTVWRDFRANLRIILQLAIGAVVFTTAAVGVAVHWMDPALPWAACFALG